jgi:hypothetical protein
VDRYGRALAALQADPDSTNQIVTQLIDIGALRKAADDAARMKDLEGAAEARARTLAAMAAMRAKLDTARDGGDTHSTLAALLETKLLVQQTLLRPEIAREHPDLYDKMNRYLDALAAESRADERLQTLRELDVLLGNLADHPPGGGK